MSVPTGLKVLVLGDDYIPLNIVGWKKAIKRLFPSPCPRCHETGFIFINGRRGKCSRCECGLIPPANVVEYFNDGYAVRDSRGREHLIPAVIANSHHVKRKYRKVPFSKHNVLRRDNFCCQYCGEQFPPDKLSYDHVVPRSMWVGNDTPTCWKNIVAACLPCNRKKDNKTPEQAGMPLRKWVNGHLVEYKRPKAPTSQSILLGLSYRHIPEEWKIYVEPFMK